MISKIIWQTHEWDYEDLPEIYKKTSKTWKALNPDWEYRYLNEKQRKDMIKEIYPSFLSRYDSYYGYTHEGKNIGGMLQCDLWRVLCLHEYGGVYADMDAICLGPLNGMLDLYSDKDIVISSYFITKPEHQLLENSAMGIPYNFQVNSGAGFAAKKNSSILKLMIDVIEGKEKNPNLLGGLWEIFNSICINSDIDLISYDFRWSLHSSAFNHKTYT